MSASWTVDRALFARWKEHNLDALFKSYWQTGVDRAFHPFNDGEARANTPMPYCVYEAGSSFRTGRSTGGPCEAKYSIEYWTVPVQFSIWAASRRAVGEPGHGRTGKDIAYELLGLPRNAEDEGHGLLKAFDDSAGALALDGQDRHIRTDVENDACYREDDDVWRVVLMLNVMIERRRLIRGLA